MDAYDPAVTSGHLRFGDRDGLLEALRRLGVTRGAPVPVWPPRRLPHGLYLSPPTDGWLSVWSPLEDLSDWFPDLTATLECPGLVLQAEPEWWAVSFHRDGRFLGAVELPTELARYEVLIRLAGEQLEAEGGRPDDLAALDRRAEALRGSEALREALAEWEAHRPTPGALTAFVSNPAAAARAWEALNRLDRDVGANWAEADYDAEEYAAAFAAALGLRDALWSPAPDADALAEGDYDEGEGLPERWRDFLVAPIPHLRVLG